MLPVLTSRLMQGESLSASEAESAMNWILAPETPDAAIASFLTALAMKGETAEEIAGFARIMRQHAVKVSSPHERLIDTAGTGGGASTFNVSTGAAFVIAGAGVPVAKHGNRAVTSRSGSADVLAELGLRIDRSPEVAERALNEIGLAFLFAPTFHPAMKRVAQIRRQLGHRTIFNLLGPLTNPAGAAFQVVGVYSLDLTETVAKALALLDCRRAWVVHSLDGMDEVAVLAPTRVSEVQGGQVRSFELPPQGGAPSQGELEIIAGATPSASADLIRGILQGTVRGLARELVVRNAAAALHVAGDGDLPEALQKAQEAVDSGAALKKLEELVEFYHS